MSVDGRHDTCRIEIGVDKDLNRYGHYGYSLSGELSAKIITDYRIFKEEHHNEKFHGKPI